MPGTNPSDGTPQDSSRAAPATSPTLSRTGSADGDVNGPGNGDFATALHQLLGAFKLRPLLTARKIRELADSNREEFLRNAISIVAADPESRSSRFLIAILANTDMLFRTLCEPSLSGPDAVELARSAVQCDPKLDGWLLKHVAENRTPEGIELMDAESIRLLEIVEAITKGSRILPQIAKLVQHPSLRVRSKVALLAGKLQKKPKWLERRLEELDPRELRGIAVEPGLRSIQAAV
jgi:hypothetical protein